MNSQLKRIYDNVLVALHVGSFPGHMAEGLAEARQLISALVEKLEKDIVNEDGSGDRVEAGAGGLGSDSVSPQGREGTAGDAVGPQPPSAGS